MAQPQHPRLPARADRLTGETRRYGPWTVQPVVIRQRRQPIFKPGLTRQRLMPVGVVIQQAGQPEQFVRFQPNSLPVLGLLTLMTLIITGVCWLIIASQTSQPPPTTESPVA